MQMSEGVIFAVRLSSAIGSGLMAGLFFAFSVAVMRGLGRLPPAHGMAAMRAINVAILNPVFLTVFLATGALCLVVFVSSLWRWRDPGAVSFVVGAGLYLAGAFVTTVAVNVPMNEALASMAPGDPNGTARWAAYLTTWTAWNHVRTVAALAAAVLLTLALCTRVLAPA